MVEAYRERVRVEVRRARVRAFGINLGLVYYVLISLLYFVAGSLGVPEDASSSGPWYGALFAVAIALAALWTRSVGSPGRLVVARTTPILKNTDEARVEGFWRGPSGWVTGLAFALTLILGWRMTDSSLRELFSPRGMAGARRIFVALLTPELSILGMVLAKMVETIFIAFQATLIAIPVAFVTSFPTARNLMKGSASKLGVYYALRFVFNFTRSVEPIIWAIIFSVWVGIGPFAGMLALMLHSVSALAKLYSEQVENVDRGPIEALEATGAGTLQVLWHAVVPQVFLPFVSFTIYRWDINIRMATIIGLVGGGGVGTLLMQYQGLARWHEVGTIVIVIALVVWVMDTLSAKVREALY